MLSTFLQNDGIKVNVNGEYGEITTDPQTGQYVLNVNTQGKPVYGQPVQQGALMSQNVGGVPIMAIVAIVFVLAVVALLTRSVARVS